MKTIRKGDTGEEVKVLQSIIGVTADGIFGPVTESRVKEWQREHNLFPDGIVGPKTWAILNTINPQSSPLTTHLPFLKKSKRTINMIVVHCSATPVGR